MSAGVSVYPMEDCESRQSAGNRSLMVRCKHVALKSEWGQSRRTAADLSGRRRTGTRTLVLGCISQRLTSAGSTWPPAGRFVTACGEDLTSADRSRPSASRLPTTRNPGGPGGNDWSAPAVQRTVAMPCEGTSGAGGCRRRDGPAGVDAGLDQQHGIASDEVVAWRVHIKTG